MTNTLLRNKYGIYWKEEPKEWHRNLIGEYHVSAIGVDHQEFNPNDHSGPCLRQTFYFYVDPLPFTEQTEGNFHMGRIIHKELQRIYIINHPNAVAEFPLGLETEREGEKIKHFGSIDLMRIDLDGLHVPDIKSASDWTFPKTSDDKNQTHFDQSRIYVGWLISRILNTKFMKVKTNGIIYVDKHNLYTGEQFEKTNKKLCIERFVEFIDRSWALHNYLIEEKLPPKEPNKWCKFCDYRHRCNAEVIHEDEVPTITMKEAEHLYQKMTGKSPKWRGNYTKGFESFIWRYKISDG